MRNHPRPRSAPASGRGRPLGGSRGRTPPPGSPSCCARPSRSTSRGRGRRSRRGASPDPGRAGHRGGGRRCRRPAPPRRESAGRSPTDRGSCTPRSRRLRGSPRGDRPSARPGARSARPPWRRSPGRSSAPCEPGPPFPWHRARGGRTTCAPRSSSCRPSDVRQLALD